MDEPHNPYRIPWFLIIMSFLIGALSVVGYEIYKTIPKKLPQPLSHKPAPSPSPAAAFVMMPPTQAITGTLSAFVGDVTIQTREAADFQTATPGGMIRLGEGIATGESSAATIDLLGLGRLQMTQYSEVNFANLFPTNTVLWQKSGKVQYDINAAHPVAVRVLHTLVSTTTGILTINIVDSDLSISVATGSAKIAFVDTNNTTHAWELTKGHRANIDDANRQIYFALP